MTISEWLTRKPQTKRQLADRSGYSLREVELLIHAARLEGVPIVSTTDGYYLSTDPAEVLACSVRLHNRAVRQMETAQALGKAAQRLKDQSQATLWSDAA